MTDLEYDTSDLDADAVGTACRRGLARDAARLPCTPRRELDCVADGLAERDDALLDLVAA